MTPHAESSERDCAGYAPGSTRTILTSLSGGIVDHEGKKAPTVSVFAAAANACSGDVIELVAGDFALAGRAVVVRRHPSDPFEGPITLRGQGEPTRILGGTQPGFKRSTRSMRPDANEHACVRLDGEAHIVIERLQYEATTRLLPAGAGSRAACSSAHSRTGRPINTPRSCCLTGS